MCTKWFSDGDVHKYFNHYDTPYEAYMNYMNVLADFRLRLEDAQNISPLPTAEKIKQIAPINPKVNIVYLLYRLLHSR
jgi:hypothetical protein